MSTTLPRTVRLQTTKRTGGTAEVKVKALASTEIPAHDAGKMEGSINSGFIQGGWKKDMVKPHLTSWGFPEDVRRIRERCEQILQDGIPNQKRTMLRNQAFGVLDQRWVGDIAAGNDVDRPFQRWSKAKHETISVAICLDSSVAGLDPAEMLKARMTVAAGLASALEFLDYDTAIIGANVSIGTDDGDYASPRERPDVSYVAAAVCKDWDEPFSDGGMASMSDTGIRTLLNLWLRRQNGMNTSLTDAEWRELTDADLLIHIGNSDRAYNTEGKPRDAVLGVTGDDTLSLRVSRMRDVQPAIDALEAFFVERFGDR